MSERYPNTSQSIKIRPIVNYPREAQTGQTYLMTIDVQLASLDTPWPYPEEEYPISFILNTQPYFRYEPLSDESKPAVVLHRFGGTYGPAHYLLTASEQPVALGHITITFVNGHGLPITHLALECTVTQEAAVGARREVIVSGKVPIPSTPVREVPEVEAEFAVNDVSVNIDREAEFVEEIAANSQEETIRLRIEDQLVQAGWLVQDSANVDIQAGQGIVIHDFPLLRLEQKEIDSPWHVRLRQERLSHGWAQEDLATRIEVDPKTVGRWEHGRSFPRPYMRQKLVEIFGKSIEEWGLAPANESGLTSSSAPSEQFTQTRYDAAYLIVIDGEAVGVIEVRTPATSPSSTQAQVSHSFERVPTNQGPIRFSRSPLPFSYITNGEEIFFTNGLEPDARSRRVFHFHKPETLAEWLRMAPVGRPNEQNNLLRSCLRRMPALSHTDLRACQYEAITSLEQSLAENRPRALIQMATGSGKTYMAVSSIYRLLRFGNARRVLYLVDRMNLGSQALSAFSEHILPDRGRRFVESYRVQLLLLRDHLDPTAEICITTVQHLYSLLAGGRSLFERSDDAEEDPTEEQRPRAVQYNPEIPIECFDMIFIDECHRSLYAEWRPVLEYFDAFLIGLTATPDSRAFAFFQRNLVYKYSHEQAVADGVNVDYDVYSLLTNVEETAIIPDGPYLYLHDKQARVREDGMYGNEMLDQERLFGHNVVSFEAIQMMITGYREALFTELFPGRTEVPKTIIFARNNRHADDILRIVREVFGRGDDFAQKITTLVSREKPTIEEQMQRFRTTPYPRIAVTINVFLGTAVAPVEAIILMRSVQGRTRLEQMIATGCGTIRAEELRQITPDAESKTRCVVIDAAGAMELEVFSSRVAEINLRFSSWLARQQSSRQQPFTEEQIRWLERIRDRIATDFRFEEQGFERPPFSFDGGRVTARFLFGSELPTILQELNSVLIQ